MKNKIGFLVVALAVFAMVFAVAATAAPVSYTKELKKANTNDPVTFGYLETVLVKAAKAADKRQDCRHMFKNILRSKSSFDRIWYKFC